MGNSSATPSSAHKDPPWQELHVDLLCLIARKLSLSDRIKLSLVCKLWRSKKDSYILSVHEIPRLILPHEPNFLYLRWLDLSRGEIENFKLPNSFRRRDYIGSSNGWLIFQGISHPSFFETDNHIFSLYLFNPISCKVVGLPSLKTSWKPVSNVIVSSNQVSPNLMVAAIIASRSRIVVCKPRMKNWSHVVAIPLIVQNVKYPRIYSNILFQGDTLFVSSRTNLYNFTSVEGQFPTQIKTWSLEKKIVKLGTSTLKIVFLNVGDALFTVLEYRYYYGCQYLALSAEGELMMMIRWHRLKQDQENPRVTYFSTENIIIHKLSSSENGNFLNSVCDIGDHILFLGRTHSQILSSKIFNGRRNCVIFMEDCYGVNGQSGVFNLETRKTECLAHIRTKRYPFRLDWFLPTLS